MHFTLMFQPETFINAKMYKLHHLGYAVLLLLFTGLSVFTRVHSNTNLNAFPDNVYVGPGPVIFVSPASTSDSSGCGYVPVDLCFQKLQTFLKLNSLPFPTESIELDRLCSEAISGYLCAGRLQSNANCMTPKDKDMMLVYVSMAEKVVMMFCPMEGPNTGYRGKDLLESSKCIRKQREDLDCCAKQTKLPDLPIMNILDSSKSFTEKQISTCCPLSSYINCAQTVVKDNCDEQAANLTYEYFRRASGEQLEAVCQKLPGYPELNQEVCKMSPPTCAGCRIKTVTELLLLIGLLFIVRNNYI